MYVLLSSLFELIIINQPNIFPNVLSILILKKYYNKRALGLKLRVGVVVAGNGQSFVINTVNFIFFSNLLK